MAHDMTIVDEQETAGMFPLAGTATTSAVAQMAGALLDKRLATARAFPRSVARFKTEARALLSEDLETARAAEYAKPVGGGFVRGASVRLAELAAMCWGNLEVEVSSVDVGEKQVTVRAIAWDLQRNYRQEAVAVTTIVDRAGRRYKDSMIENAILSTASKAKRNAILSVIPRAFVSNLLEHARAVARGTEKTLEQLRTEAVEFFAKRYKVSDVRICGLFGVAGVDDLTAEHVDDLRAIVNALRDGSTVDEFFPPEPTSDRLDSLRRATNREPVPTPPQPPAKGRKRAASAPIPEPTPERIPEPVREFNPETDWDPEADLPPEALQE